MPLDHVTKLCGARTRKGESCRNPAMSNGRCRNHSGKALIGIASPSFKTGRYSSSMPARMMPTYERMLSDPQVADSRIGIARMEARIEDLLSQVDHGESGELWEALTEAWQALGDVVRKERRGDGDPSENTRDTDDAIESLGMIISQGGSNFRVWQEIRETEEQRRKCADSQTKREYAAVNALNTVQQGVLLGAVAALLKTYVRDPRDLAAAARRLHEISIHPSRSN